MFELNQTLPNLEFSRLERHVRESFEEDLDKWLTLKLIQCDNAESPKKDKIQIFRDESIEEDGSFEKYRH